MGFGVEEQQKFGFLFFFWCIFLVENNCAAIFRSLSLQMGKLFLFYGLKACSVKTIFKKNQHVPVCRRESSGRLMSLTLSFSCV